MPAPDSILAGLTALAKDWMGLAIGWHLFLGAFLLALGAGWRPSYRHACYLLVPLPVSVALLAWASANPFNGLFFSAIAISLLFAARRLSNQAVRLSRPPLLAAGALVVAFGWFYPHFVKAEHWTTYLYAAPLGIVPCPTLSALIGLVLITGLFRAPTCAAVIAAAGLVYGSMGVFWLRVQLDCGLLAGATLLAGAAARSAWRSIEARTSSPLRHPPEDEFISSDSFGRVDSAAAERKDAA